MSDRPEETHEERAAERVRAAEDRHADDLRRLDEQRPGWSAGAGIAIGAGIGAAIGAATGEMAIWLPVGIAVGLALGFAIGSGRFGGSR